MKIRTTILGVVAAGILCTVSVNAASAQAQNPPPQVSMVGVGSEDLQGFGPLTFRYFLGQRVEMTDAAGIVQGTWQINGNEVVMAFYNSTVMYRGTFQGNRLSGRASNGQVSWNWSVVFQEPIAPNMPAAPNAPPAAKIMPAR